MARREPVDHIVDDVGVVKAGASCNVAAVLFTYRCTIACRHCCFGCSGARPDVAMQPQRCAQALAMLHETGRVIHIAGGEAMLYWDTLAEALRLACERGVAPHFIETNCSFAVNDNVVRERLLFMREQGVRGLLASCDPYHQAFVPAERFLRVRRLAIEIFGEQNFWGSRADDAAVREFEEIARDEARLRDYVRSNPPALVGSAKMHLAQYLDGFSPDDPHLPGWAWHGSVEAACAAQFRTETMWELHIDPYGNLQTNCGIILGNMKHTTPARLFDQGPENASRFVRTVCTEGALGLARLAESEYGFTMPERVSQTCELCYLARRHLRRHHPEVFGPAEIYA